MSIFYRKITTASAEPSTPGLGEIWIKPVADGYQSYMWLNAWIALPGGGISVDETDTDLHYINVITQEEMPLNIPAGWIWIKFSLLQARLSMLSDKGYAYREQDFVVIAGA